MSLTNSILKSIWWCLQVFLIQYPQDGGEDMKWGRTQTGRQKDRHVQFKDDHCQHKGSSHAVLFTFFLSFPAHSIQLSTSLDPTDLSIHTHTHNRMYIHTGLTLWSRRFADICQVAKQTWATRSKCHPKAEFGNTWLNPPAEGLQVDQLSLLTLAVSLSICVDVSVCLSSVWIPQGHLLH